MLKNKAHLLPPFIPEKCFPSRHRLSISPHLAAGGPEQSGKSMHQRAFACTVGTCYQSHCAVPKANADFIEDQVRRAAAAAAFDGYISALKAQVSFL
jgi:hypothetical protein